MRHEYMNLPYVLFWYLNLYAKIAVQLVKNWHCRWGNIKALPGADRLIKHLKSRDVPMALASNSPRENIETKISFRQGMLSHF